MNELFKSAGMALSEKPGIAPRKGRLMQFGIIQQTRLFSAASPYGYDDCEMIKDVQFKTSKGVETGINFTQSFYYTSD